jgi:hypothetical protein
VVVVVVGGTTVDVVVRLNNGTRPARPIRPKRPQYPALPELAVPSSAGVVATDEVPVVDPGPVVVCAFRLTAGPLSIKARAKILINFMPTSMFGGTTTTLT